MLFRRITARYFRKGGSYAVLVPPAVRDFLCLSPGDVVLYTLVDDAAVMVRVDHNRILELAEARKLAQRAKLVSPEVVNA